MYEINLLPTKVQKNNVDVKKMLLILFVILGSIALITSYSLFLSKLYNAHKKLNNIEKRQNQIALDLTRLEQLRKVSQKEDKKIRAFQSIINNRLKCTSMLDDIACNMPVDLKLTSIEVIHRENYTPQGGFASPGMLINAADENDGKQGKIKELDFGNSSNKNSSKLDGKNDNSNKDAENKSLPSPNVLIFQGVSYSTVSVGVFIHNLSQLTYFTSINLIKASVEISGESGQAFTIEAQLREVYVNASK